MLEAPPPIRTGRLPSLEGGSALLALHPKPHESQAGKAMAATVTSDANGRLLAPPETFNEAYIFEGRPRRGETIGLAIWIDGSLATWRPSRTGNVLFPAVFAFQEIASNTLGRWDVVCTQSAIRLETRTTRYRSTYGYAQTDENGAPLYGEGPCTNPNAKRMAAVVEANVLQGLWAVLERTHAQPPMLWPANEAPRKGWTVPPFADATCGHSKHACSQALRDVMLPVLARHIAAKTLAAPISVRASGAALGPNGAPLAPRFDINLSNPTARNTIATALDKTLQAAWNTGKLGRFFAWFDPQKGEVAHAVIDPSTLSRHTLLAAIAAGRRRAHA